MLSRSCHSVFLRLMFTCVGRLEELKHYVVLRLKAVALDLLHLLEGLIRVE